MSDSDQRDRDRDDDQDHDDVAGRRGSTRAPADRQARTPRDRQGGPEVNR